MWSDLLSLLSLYASVRAVSRQLVLVHEDIGPNEQEQATRRGATFELVIASTPAQLVQMQIYSRIAVPLKGGLFRAISLALCDARTMWRMHAACLSLLSA